MDIIGSEIMIKNGYEGSIDTTITIDFIKSEFFEKKHSVDPSFKKIYRSFSRQRQRGRTAVQKRE